MNRFYTGQLPDVPIAQLFLKWFQAPPAHGGFSKRNTVRSARTCPQSAKSGVVVARELRRMSRNVSFHAFSARLCCLQNQILPHIL